MNRVSAREQVHRLFEQLYNAIDKPVLQRDTIRELTDEISTLTMIRLEPAVDEFLVELSGQKFSRQEGKLIEYLYRRMGQTISKQTLMNVITSPESTEKLVQVLICHIRKALVRLNKPYHIQTVWGLGYRMYPLKPGDRRQTLDGERMAIAMRRHGLTYEQLTEPGLR